MTRLLTQCQYACPLGSSFLVGGEPFTRRSRECSHVRFWTEADNAKRDFETPMSPNDPYRTGPSLLLLHHLVIDQLEGLGRHADFSPKRMIEQSDQTNHRAGEERDKPSKQQMGADP